MTEEIEFIADIFGFEKQSQQAMEELAELIQALSKYNRGKENALENVIEEIADVEIMIEQLKYLLNIKEEQVEKIKSLKVCRTLTQIEGIKTIDF